MDGVLAGRTPLKVRGGVVRLVAVNVVDLIAGLLPITEGKRHKPMHGHIVGVLRAHGLQAHSDVAVVAKDGLANDTPARPDAAKIAHMAAMLKAGDRTPDLL